MVSLELYRIHRGCGEGKLVEVYVFDVFENVDENQLQKDTKYLSGTVQKKLWDIHLVSES